MFIKDNGDLRVGRSIAAAIAAVIALVVLFWAIGVISIFGAAETAKITNKPRETIIVFNPNRSLATYEGFYSLCNEFNSNIIKAADAQREAKDRQAAYDPKGDPFGQERGSISAVQADARALRNQARNLAAQYNADSAANTRAPFKAADLPYTLDPNGAQQAQCGASKEAGR